MTKEQRAEAYAKSCWEQWGTDSVSIMKDVCNDDIMATAFEAGFDEAITIIMEVVDKWTKRSEYGWSSGGSYSEVDIRNEVAIKTAQAIKEEIKKLGEL